eukprot:scaffold46664_cov63-Attheya_sp.AAC.2
MAGAYGASHCTTINQFKTNYLLGHPVQYIHGKCRRWRIYRLLIPGTVALVLPLSSTHALQGNNEP